MSDFEGRSRKLGGTAETSCGFNTHFITFPLLQPLFVQLLAGIQLPSGPHLTGRHLSKAPFAKDTEVQEPFLIHGLHLQPFPLQEPLEVHGLQVEGEGNLLEEVQNTGQDFNKQII